MISVAGYRDAPSNPADAVSRAVLPNRTNSANDCSMVITPSAFPTEICERS